MPDTAQKKDSIMAKTDTRSQSFVQTEIRAGHFTQLVGCAQTYHPAGGIVRSAEGVSRRAPAESLIGRPIKRAGFAFPSEWHLRYAHVHIPYPFLCFPSALVLLYQARSESSRSPMKACAYA